MAIERLRNASKARPLRPFVVHLADGREIPVRHRGLIMTVPNGRAFIARRPDE